MFRSFMLSTLACTCAFPAIAGTFSVVDVGSSVVLGTFEAPDAGGAVTAGSFTLEGGVFDTLGTGSEAPLYDAANNWVTGTPGGFGGFYNSVAFNTFDFLNNPLSCGVGECVFSLTSSSGSPVPAEWHVDYLPNGGAPIALGNYTVETAAIPLPASVLLLLSGLGALGLRRSARKD